MKINTTELPDETLNQHAAILGKTGSGKTYAAKGIVEHLLSLGRRVCVLDPTGAWHGMRSSADGTKPGFRIIVFGGDHADVPINEHAGHAVGELVATQDVASVIDLSGTTLGERHRFVERFAESLFRANKRPLHLIIDEADEFAPQSGAPGTERMLGAIDRIVRRGRIKGFRVIMISQRPAVLNKNVLTQANTLIAMRLPATQDRKAIELWIKGQADEGQAGEVLRSLASLQRGEGWIWSPEHGVLSRVKFPPITTFDSSRTPDDGQTVETPRTLASIDLAAVNAAMAEAVQIAKENDPKELRAEISKLKKQIGATPISDPYELKRSASLERRRIREAAAPSILEALQTIGGLRINVETIASRLNSAISRLEDPDDDVREVSSPEQDRRGVIRQSVEDRAGVGLAPHPGPRLDVPGLRNGHIPSQKAAAPKDSAGLTRPQQKLIDAIAWWNTLDIQPDRTQAAHIAGYTPSGGTWRNLMSECRSLMLIGDVDGKLVLSEDGADKANFLDDPPTHVELIRRVGEQLTNPQRKVLNFLVNVRGESTRTETAERNGYEASGGTFRNLLSELSGLGLITYPKKTTVKAADWLIK